MKFKFTYHAQYRMEKRKISTLDIKNIISNPDYSRIEESGTIVCIKSIRGKGKIGVVYRKLKDEFLIITMYHEK